MANPVNRVLSEQSSITFVKNHKESLVYMKESLVSGKGVQTAQSPVWTNEMRIKEYFVQTVSAEKNKRPKIPDLPSVKRNRRKGGC